MNDALLILDDGTELPGRSFGARASRAGEVVFNTAMSGYPESLTDPSYAGQILTFTYPLIGNYGVPGDDRDPATGLPLWLESDRVHVQGVVVSQYSANHSHWNARRSLAQWLAEQGVPAIEGVDTRFLAQHIRDRGAMLAKIVIDGADVPWRDPNTENLVAQVSPTEVTTYGSGRHHIVMVDTGAKYNILRCLLRRDTRVTRVPWDYDFNTLDYDGLMLSNGPGDPTQCQATVEHIREAVLRGKPIFGICLGNQLLGLAAGGSTFKLPYGHRAHNHPVRRCGTNQCYITSQNHGFALDTATLGDDWQPSFVNINDGTNEGIRHKHLPIFSTQFHPEASSGPWDTESFFDEFIANVARAEQH